MSRVDVDGLVDAYEAGGKNSQMCTLILTQGVIAKNLAIDGRSVLKDHDYYGVFPVKEEFLNVREARMNQIALDDNIHNISKCLGLRLYGNTKTLRYGRVMILTSPNHEGVRLKGLLINYFHYFWPSLLKTTPSFLSEFILPVVKATHKSNGEVLSFYSMPEFNGWKTSLRGSTVAEWGIRFYERVESCESLDFMYYFIRLDFHRKDFVWEGGQDGEAILLAFSPRKVESRRNWLLNFEPGIHCDRDLKEPRISYNDFVNKQLILVFMADIQSLIPSTVDGLTPSQRKILFCSFQRNFKRATVAEVAYSASDDDAPSLYNTIIKMAQDYVDTNNINLFLPLSQFGCRNSGIRSAGRPTIIYTELSPAARVLFPKDDDVLLHYLAKDGKMIEPAWYLPVIPVVLVNGCKRVGNGLSSFVPKYNPREIVANVRRLLNGESVVPMDPWYRGFIGTIVKTASNEGGSTYTTTGIYEEVDDTTVHIKELPIGMMVDEYKESLREMKTDQGPFIQLITGYCVRFVDIQFKLSKENMMQARQKGFLKAFNLTTTISTGNMFLYDQNGVIRKYATPEQILEEFFNLRLQYYEKRKEVVLKNLELELLKLEHKVEYIAGIFSGEIRVIPFDEAYLLQEFRQRGFTRFPKKSRPVEAAVDGEISDYEYLVKISFGSLLTGDKVQELRAEGVKMKEEIEYLKKATSRDLWLRDLEALELVLEKLNQND